MKNSKSPSVYVFSFLNMLFFVMEFLELFYINFDIYSFIFFSKIININLNMPSGFL